MFLHRSLSTWLVTSLLLVVVIGGLAALAARDNGYDIQPLQQPQSLTNGPARATSRFRNLSLQPEAAKLSVRLGQRFIGSESGVSVLIGEITAADLRVPVRIVRRSEEHTSELQSRLHLVCRLLLEKKKKKFKIE